MASIRKGKNGKWRVRYRGPDGRERAKTFALRSDAAKYATSVEHSKLRGEWIDPQRGKVTLATWAEEWQRTTVHLKAKTIENYESLLRVHVLPAFGRASIAAIEPSHVKQWVAAMRAEDMSPSRIRQAYRVLSAMMKAAVEQRYIVRTPCIGVALPRERRSEMHFLSAAQVDVLAERIADPYDTLVYVLAYAGIRWGEAAALRRRRVDLLRGRLEICESLSDARGQLTFGATKTYQHRWVTLPSFLRDRFSTHLDKNVPTDPDALVFTTPVGTPLRGSNFRRNIWTKALKPRCPAGHILDDETTCSRCGAPAIGEATLPAQLRIHDLRHTCAALLIAQGAHPKAIQTHLGHATITVTLDRYGHLFPDEMDRLADALDSAWQQAQAIRR